MSRQQQKKRKAPPKNQKRARVSLGESLRSANRRAHEETNRRLNRRGGKPVWAAISLEEIQIEEDSSGFLQRVIRWVLGLVLLPLCWVTTWTFLTRFSEVTLHEGFWQTHEFWYFATGVLLMTGWFWSGIGKPFFLYLYVLGHEVTHAFFVKLFGGKVLDISWSSEGGYVTTDKTNWMIALSPYFVPFWTTVLVMLYVSLKFAVSLESSWDQVFYALVGASWAFHMVWTLWMIPKDQPDLKDNGTFLSLVLIYFGNLIVLIALLCLAGPAPMEALKGFGADWFRIAVTWADAGLRWAAETMAGLERAARL